MAKDPYSDLEEFGDDEFAFDELDNLDGEFDGLSMDGFEEIDSESERSPVSESRLNTRVLRGVAAAAAGGASALLTRKISDEFPETRNLVDEGLNIATDVVRLKDEFMRDITPTVNSLKAVGRRVLPRIEDAVPKNIYDKIDKALQATDYGGKDPNQGETNDVVLANTLKEIFSAEQTLDKFRTKDAKMDALINRQLQSSQHRELATMVNDIRTFTLHQTAFHRQISVPYMKKMLELKYQHLWATRDILDVLKLIAQTTEKKLDEIRHNTSLPDIQKEKLTEKYKDMMRDKMLGGITQYVSDFGKDVLSNLKTNVLGPGKDMMDMLADIGEGVAMGLEMDEEMAEMEGRKPQSLMGTAGLHAAKYVGGLGGGTVGNELRKMLAPYKGNIELTAGNTKLNAILAMDKIKRGEMDLPGGDLLAAFMESALPSLDRSAGSVKNSLFASPDEAIQFDVATRSAVIEIIPGYLAKILQQITEMNTGSPAPEMVYDPRTRTFLSDEEYRTSVANQLFGTQQERTIALREGISPLRAGLEKNGHTDRVTSFDEVADELGLVFHNLATLKDFPIVNADNFKHAYEEQDVTYNSYITSALRGCKHPLQVLELIYLSLFNENGEIDKNTYLRWTREIQKYITGKMDQYRANIEKHADRFGNMRHLSNIMEGNDASGEALLVGEDHIRKLMTDIDTKLIRDPEESKRIIEELAEQARAQKEEDASLWTRYQKRKQETSSLENTELVEDTSLTGGTASTKLIDQLSAEVTKKVPSKDDLLEMKADIEATAAQKTTGAIEQATKSSHDALTRIEAAITESQLPAKLSATKDKGKEVEEQVEQQIKAYDLKQKLAEKKAQAADKWGMVKDAVSSKTQDLKNKVHQSRTEAIPLQETETLPAIRQEAHLSSIAKVQKPSLFTDTKMADMIYDVTGTSTTREYDVQQVELLRTIAANTSAILNVIQDSSFQKKSKEGIIGKTIKAPFRIAAWGVKMPFKAVGATGRFLFGGKKETNTDTVYKDVYRQNETHLEPLITVRDLKKGLIFKDGTPVRNVHEINQEVYDPYRTSDGAPRDPLRQSAEMPMRVITEDDIRIGLMDEKNTSLSKPGMQIKSEPGILRKTAGVGVSAVKAIGGMYIKAMKGIVTSTVDVARRQFAPFTDVYTKDENDTLILVARKRTIEAFGVYEDGNPVKSVYDITEPVWNADTGEIIIGEDDIRRGLYDPQGRPLRRFGILVGNVVNKTARLGLAVGLGAAKLAVKGAQILASAAVKLGKKLLEAKNPYIDVFIKGEMDPGNPALSGEGIKYGDYCYANGTLVTSAYGIQEPVFLVNDPDGERTIGNCVVSSEDLKKGLVDIHGTLLTAWRGRSIAGKIITGISNTVMGAGKAAFAIGKGILTTGANLVGGLFGGGGGFGGREALKEFVGDKLDIIIAILSQRLQKPGPGYVSSYSYGSATDAEKAAIKAGHIVTGRVAAASSSVIAAENAANKRKLVEETKIRTRIEAKERERERRALRKRGEDLTGSPTRDNSEKGFLSKIFGTLWDVGKTLAGFSVMFFGLTKTWNKVKNIVGSIGGKLLGTETAQSATRAIRSTRAGSTVLDAAGEGLRRGTGALDTTASKIQGSTPYKLWQGFKRTNRFMKVATGALAAGAGVFGYLKGQEYLKEGKTSEAGAAMGEGAGTGAGLMFGGGIGAKIGGLLGPAGRILGGIAGSLFGYKAGAAIGKEVGGRIGSTYETYGKGYSATGKSPAAWTLFNLRCEAYGIKVDDQLEPIVDEMEMVAMQTIAENRPIADTILQKWMAIFKCTDEDKPDVALKYFRRYWTERFIPVFIIYSKALDMLGTKMDTVGEDLNDQQIKELFDLVQGNINNNQHLAKLHWLTPTREGLRTYINSTQVGLRGDKDVDPTYAEELKKKGIEDTRSYVDPRIKAGLGIGAVVAGGTGIGRHVTMQAARGAAGILNKSTAGAAVVKGVTATSDLAMAGTKVAGKGAATAGKGLWNAFMDVGADGFRAEMKGMKAAGQGAGARIAAATGGSLKNTLRTVSKFKGGALVSAGLETAMAAWDVKDALAAGDTTKATEIGVKAAGGIAGGAAGAAAGAALGTAIFPVIGTAIGGILGYYLGSSAGEALMDPIAKRIGAWVSDESGPGLFGKRRYNWGVFKYRCKLYGVADPVKYESVIDDLEKEAIRTVNEQGARGTLLTDAQALDWATRFGINTRSDAKKAAKYWLMWYKQRFLSVFLGFMGALEGAQLLYDDMDDMEAEVAVGIITEMDKQVKPIVDQISALTPDQKGYEQWYKARVTDGGMKYDPRSQNALAAQKEVERRNTNKTETSQNLQADKSDLDTMLALSEQNNRDEDAKRKAAAAAVTTPQVMENAQAAKDALRTKDLGMGDAAAMVAASGLKTSIEQAREEQSRLSSNVQSSISEQALKLFPHLYAMKNMAPGTGTKFNAMFTEEKGPGWFAPKGKYTWGLFKYRCKLYGIENPVDMEDTLDTLEEETQKWIKANNGNPELKLTEGQKYYWANKFGLEARKNPDVCKFWEQWYLRRFIPVFYLYLTAADTVSMQIQGKKVAKMSDVTAMLDTNDIAVAAAIIEALDKYTATLLSDMKELRPDMRSFKNWKKQKEIHGVDYDPYSTEALAAQANARREAEAKAIADAEAQKKKETEQRVNEAKQQSASTQIQGKDVATAATDAASKAAQTAIGAGSQQGRMPERTTTGTQQAQSQAQTQGASGVPGAEGAKEGTQPKPTVSAYVPKPGSRVGDAVAQFESGKDGSNSIGWDKNGGTSYGRYQFAARPGGLAAFIRFCLRRPEGKAFAQRMITAIGPLPKSSANDGGWGDTGSKRGGYVDAWLAGVAAGELGDLEHAYIERQMRDVMSKLQGDNPAVASMISSNVGLQEALWSTIVQHGQYGGAKGRGARGIFNTTFTEGITPQDWATKIYADRGTRFRSSTGQVQNSVKSRFGRELPIILSMMEKKEDQPATATASSEDGAGGASTGTTDRGGGDAATADAQDASSTKQAAGKVANSGMGVGIMQGTKTADLSGSKSFAPEGGTGGNTIAPTVKKAEAAVANNASGTPGIDTASSSGPPSGKAAPPTPHNVVTSAFQKDRGGRPHKGIDIRARDGEPIRAIVDGVVTQAKPSNYGTIAVASADNVSMKYLHNSKLLAKEGQPVKAGDVIAAAGGVGKGGATQYPSHLHLEIDKNGQKANPYVELSKLGIPLSFAADSGSQKPEAMSPSGPQIDWNKVLGSPVAEKDVKATDSSAGDISVEEPDADKKDKQKQQDAPPSSTQQAAAAVADQAAIGLGAGGAASSDSTSTGTNTAQQETASADTPAISPAASPMAASPGKEAAYTPPVTVAGDVKQTATEIKPAVSEESTNASLQLEQLKMMTKLLADISTSTSTMAGWNLPDALSSLGTTITQASSGATSTNGTATQTSAAPPSDKKEVPGKKPSLSIGGSLPSRTPPVSNKLVSWV